MKEIRKYVAYDGKVFDNPRDCMDYEKEKAETEEKEARMKAKKKSDEFLLSIGFDVKKYNTIAELNHAINHTWLVFDAYANFKCLKTCGNGASDVNGIKFDFRFVSGDDVNDPGILENWLRENCLYAHALCSFVERSYNGFYEWDLQKKLENLTWEFKNGKVIKTSW